MKIIPCVQGDITWFHERTGRVTASRVRDVMAKTKNGESAKRQTYKMELLAEIVTGRAAEHYVSPAMDWGLEQEPLARAMYEMVKEVEVERIGMVVHETINRFSASPDGLVGEDGLVEFKCPTTKTHLGYLLDGVVPAEYIPQMMAQMACTGRSWTDFCSYDSRLPEEFGLFVVRLNRDDAEITRMEAEVVKFIGEVNEMAERLLKHKGDGIEDALKASLKRGPAPPRAEIPDLEEVQP